MLVCCLSFCGVFGAALVLFGVSVVWLDLFDLDCLLLIWRDAGLLMNCLVWFNSVV